MGKGEENHCSFNFAVIFYFVDPLFGSLPPSFFSCWSLGSTIVTVTSLGGGVGGLGGGNITFLSAMMS